MSGQGAAGGRPADADPLAARWDAEYRDGRYAADPPLPFVQTILSTLKVHRAVREGAGLYVGCGNGRNYLPLVDSGLSLSGLDISPEAVKRLVARRPALAHRVVCANFLELPSEVALDYVVAIQVFQHGGEAEVGAYFAKVAEVLKPGGLFFLRVNSATTDVYHGHTVVERNRFGGFTVRYEEGPKRDLRVHFYARGELLALASRRFRVLTKPREVAERRSAPKTGSWVQWETVWQRRTARRRR